MNFVLHFQRINWKWRCSRRKYLGICLGKMYEPLLNTSLSLFYTFLLSTPLISSLSHSQLYSSLLSTCRLLSPLLTPFPFSPLSFPLLTSSSHLLPQISDIMSTAELTRFNHFYATAVFPISYSCYVTKIFAPVSDAHAAGVGAQHNYILWDLRSRILKCPRFYKIQPKIWVIWV